MIDSIPFLFNPCDRASCLHSKAMLLLRAKCPDYSGSIILHNANVCGFHWLQVHVETECVDRCCLFWHLFKHIELVYAKIIHCPCSDYSGSISLHIANICGNANVRD